MGGGETDDAGAAIGGEFGAEAAADDPCAAAGEEDAAVGGDGGVGVGGEEGVVLGADGVPCGAYVAHGAGAVGEEDVEVRVLADLGA